MNSYRDNPDSAESQAMTKQNIVDLFTLQFRQNLIQVHEEEREKIEEAIRTQFKPTERSRRYTCRICGGDHKEIQCNQDDFALGNE